MAISSIIILYETMLKIEKSTMHESMIIALFLPFLANVLMVLGLNFSFAFLLPTHKEECAYEERRAVKD